MTSPLASFAVDRTSSLPLHRQIEQWLRIQIETGALAPGDMLPPRKNFSEALGGINHLTIRQAVGALVREGLLYSTPGRGTFVTEHKKKQLRIALVLPNLADDLTHAIADGVQEHFALADKQRGEPVRTVVFDSRRDAQIEIDNINQLEDLPLDGAIILPVPYGNLVECLVRLKSNRFPVVIFGWVHGVPFNSVTADDYAGAYAATQHLLSRGRKRIAWVGTKYCSLAANIRADTRFEGFRDAISDAGLPYNRQLEGELLMSSPTDPFESTLNAVLDRLLACEPYPDGIVCSNDVQALACLKELRNRGFRVPEDISVVGFDDYRDSASSEPPLTTVRTPMKELGSEAAKLLLAQIQNPAMPPQSITLPVSLIIRKST